MKSYSTQVLVTLSPGISEALSRAVEPVLEELASRNEGIEEVRVGPTRPAADFLDIEGVRLRIAREQRGHPWRGQTQLVENLRTLPPEREITYVLLDTADQEAKCYVDCQTQRLLGVLWLPQTDRDAG